MLQTNLKHLESNEDINEALKNNENVAICCGRMGPMCKPVYAIFNQLETQYPHVQFYDLEFDVPSADFIKNLPECSTFRGLPFTVYFKNGKVAAATTSIQTTEQVVGILNKEFEQVTSQP